MTDLVNRMIDLCEIIGQDGAIIALDQEKAYDRIRHDYLWRTLEKLGIPQPLIKTIKSLYMNAQSVAIINGEISKKFSIHRGIRQGDPLSCLLFNLAIEPLSATLRDSCLLKGLEIKTPSLTERAIVSLFADDTVVFMSKDDSLDTLFELLEGWCMASGAKFNREKSVIIPVRTPEHRQSVSTTRKINLMSPETIDLDMKILQDRATTRYLGAQCGNHPESCDPWPLIITKINMKLWTWERAFPSLEGRKHIAQMVIGGMTQFHTMAQGMPNHIKNKLMKLTRNFIWGTDSPPPIAMSILNSPTEKGGKNVIKIKACNKVTYIMKLKQMATPVANRPLAATATEAIVLATLPKKIHEQEAHDPTILNPITQLIPHRTNKVSNCLPLKIKKKH